MFDRQIQRARYSNMRLYFCLHVYPVEQIHIFFCYIYRYLGGLLCTANGELPSNLEELWPLLRSAGIEPWELFTVDNSMSPGAIEAGPPPLDFFRKDVMLQKEKNKVANE